MWCGVLCVCVWYVCGACLQVCWQVFAGVFTGAYAGVCGACLCRCAMQVWIVQMCCVGDELFVGCL